MAYTRTESRVEVVEAVRNDHRSVGRLIRAGEAARIGAAPEQWRNRGNSPAREQRAYAGRFARRNG